ncbi:MAG: hypothetical protein MZV70_64250 [Desulfobacterales bacterium]|nr:hypothetical protein [Desulfobacterales bacterium]
MIPRADHAFPRSVFFVVSTVGRIPGTLALSLQGASIYDKDYISFVIITALSLAVRALRLSGARDAALPLDGTAEQEEDRALRRPRSVNRRFISALECDIAVARVLNNRAGGRDPSFATAFVTDSEERPLAFWNYREELEPRRQTQALLLRTRCGTTSTSSSSSTR